jgi:hypothetical protein
VFIEQNFKDIVLLKKIIKFSTNLARVSTSLFGNAVAVIFQSAFHSGMYQNNIFFLKIIFDISTSKRSKNTKKILI